MELSDGSSTNDHDVEQVCVVRFVVDYRVFCFGFISRLLLGNRTLCSFSSLDFRVSSVVCGTRQESSSFLASCLFVVMRFFSEHSFLLALWYTIIIFLCCMILID